MTRKPDLTCAVCAKPMWGTNGALPQGQATCQPCRRSLRPKLQSKQCERCGANFKPDVAATRFCSRRCHNPPRSCEVCNGEYRASYYEQRTCGRYCGAILRGCAIECSVIWRTCQCGAEYSKPGRHCQSAVVHLEATRPPLLPQECDGCGETFTPPNYRGWRYCSSRCSSRAGRMRRRVLEAGSYGHWRWSDFMRIAARFDYCCAYCGDKPERLDPDHVIPLARTGPNTTSNLLPACQRCNGQKTDMFLHEWAAYREARGLPRLRTEWDEDDPRYFHLTAVRSSTNPQVRAA